MHYLFLDESYAETHDTRAIVVASWAVEQGRWNYRAGRLSELFRPPILERIDSTLKSLDALAVVAKATLATSLFRPGGIDGTDDIPAMARADNIWSQCVIFAVGSLIKEFLPRRQGTGTTDVYFDPKSLKRNHTVALEKVLRQTVVSEARRYASELGVDLFRKLKIRHIRPVEKPGECETHTRLQLGTWVSHKLCSYSDEITSTGGTPQIKTHDMSDVVRRTVQQFDGKTFHDD